MRKLALLCFAVFTLSACCEEKGMTPKQEFEAAAEELGHGVGLISVYLPYLEAPKSQGKHDPRPTARDVQPRQERAANAIRMAAHGARQRGAAARKHIWDPLSRVARDCTRTEGDAAVKKCKDAVSALDVELEKLAKSASDAGASGKMPRIGADAITDASKKGIEPYLKALGPTPKEAETLKALEDPKADIANLTIACDAAAEEQKLVEKTYEGVDEGLRKLAVKHRFAIEAICRIVKRIEASKAELTPCEKDENKEKPECVLACSKAKGYVDTGMPCAAQETYPDYYKEICVEEED
jgi:hypothetical protein